MTRRALAPLVLLVLVAGVKVAAGDAERSAGTRKLSLPGRSWSLLVDLPGFKREQESTLPDGSGTMLRASNRMTDLVASVFLEREPDLDSTEACKAFYWAKSSKSPLPVSDVRFAAHGPMAVVHWTVREFRGVPLMQKNINAYLYHDGTCIDVHLSKIHYTPADDPLFSAVLDSVRFADR